MADRAEEKRLLRRVQEGDKTAKDELERLLKRRGVPVKMVTEVRHDIANLLDSYMKRHHPYSIAVGEVASYPYWYEVDLYHMVGGTRLTLALTARFNGYDDPPEGLEQHGIPMTHELLARISNYLGTTDLNIGGRDSYHGCSTCGHGARASQVIDCGMPTNIIIDWEHYERYKR